MLVGGCVCERERVCVCERESVCVRVRERARERERERESERETERGSGRGKRRLAFLWCARLDGTVPRRASALSLSSSLYIYLSLAFS